MTPEYVRRLIKTGKITKSSLKTSGKRKLIHPEKARTDLANNVSHVNKKSQKTKQNKPKNKTQKRNTKKAETEQTDASSGKEVYRIIDLAEFGGLNLTEAQTIHEQYKAALKKLDYEKRERELLPADEVRKIWSESITAARSKILSLKGKIGPLLKEFIGDSKNFNTLMSEVEQIEFEVLKDLQRGEVQ
ncbi:hypothetical protein [Desulfoluna spongiiphila]|uniref:Uncharacterized protein n=1 Tax=Desulfoluna spongiiphila TaxID=419481 RepID=A0A1G5G055_9BACT|nr:hypothetical protein [Desulfoluna spongiiphila]SCY44916.1 hypothetical protein SAMN05216233_109120 [Desulfoluna spongiiphila]